MDSVVVEEPNGALVVDLYIHFTVHFKVQHFIVSWRTLIKVAHYEIQSFRGNVLSVSPSGR